MDEWSILTRL
jgi:hypothetical protein